MSFINSQLNLLSVFDECAKLVGASTGLLVAAASTLLPHPIDIYMGEEFCIFVNLISVFGITYGIFGGTGIALMRFVFIKCPSKVTGKIGKREICPTYLFGNNYNDFSISLRMDQLVNHARRQKPSFEF